MKMISAGKFIWTSPLIFLLLLPVTSARTLLVPESYSTINGAMTQSIAEDTILVNRGIYGEQLWFPAHRIFIMSHYELTQDTLDVSQTVIEGYSYSDHDTATIALFLSGAADWSKLCGFTLQGGHGVGPGNHSGAFLADSCSPSICHNVVTGNQTLQCPVGQFRYCSGVLRGNHFLNNEYLGVGLRIGYNLYWEPILIEGNTFGYNPFSPDASLPGIQLYPGSRAIIRGNLFRGLSGVNDLAISGDGCVEIEISNNVFDSLVVRGSVSALIWLWDSHNIIVNDNEFSNLQLELQDGNGLVSIMDDRTVDDVSIEGNVFEYISCSETSAGVVPGIWVQSYNGVIRNNIFRSNRGNLAGAVYIIQAGQVMPTGIALEYNLFEACTTSFDSPYAAAVMRFYDGPVIAHHNIFRRNYPCIVTVDNIHPSRIADFTLNYWGDPTGPYHPLLNPNGLGDTVGDSVFFNPWLTDSIISSTPAPLPPLPTEFKLESYPNPFNMSARIKLMVPEPGRYRVELRDLLGRKVRELWDGAVVIDREVTFTADGLASGVYFARASESLSRRPVATVKLVLMK